jgi:hypothetical protein
LDGEGVFTTIKKKYPNQRCLPLALHYRGKLELSALESIKPKRGKMLS